MSARAWLRLLGTSGMNNYDPGPELIASREIHEIVRRLAAAHALDVLDDLGDRGARLGERGGRRGDGDAGVLPQRIARRERPAFQHMAGRERQVARPELVD